jgi:hypothetical protein
MTFPHNRIIRRDQDSEGTLMEPAIVPSVEIEKRLARRLASGQGDLIYAVTLIVMLIAILRALFSI